MKTIGFFKIEDGECDSGQEFDYPDFRRILTMNKVEDKCGHHAG